MKSSKRVRGAAGLKIGIVAAKFNQSVTRKLLLSCLAGFAKLGVKDSLRGGRWRQIFTM